jgi:hypothetical protein
MTFPYSPFRADWNDIPAWYKRLADDGLLFEPGGGATAEAFGASPQASGVVNVSAIQQAVNLTGYVSLTIPGVYALDLGSPPSGDPIGMISVPSNTTIYLGAGVILQMPTSGNLRTVFFNSNWRSNSRVITISGGVSQTNRSLVTVTENSHNVKVGDYQYIKNETSQTYNGVWQVVAVTANTWQFYLWENGGLTTGAGTGTILAYNANAFINIIGPGLIDYQLNVTNGGVAGNAQGGVVPGITGVCTCIFNKIADSGYSLGVINAPSNRNFFASNFYRVFAKDITYRGGGTATQFLGPFNDLTVSNISGQGDDIVAIFTDDPSGIQLYDSDNTINTSGAIEGVYVDDIRCTYDSTRNVIICSDNSHRIDRVDVKRLYRVTNNPPSKLVEIATSPSQTGVFGTMNFDGLYFEPGQGCNMIFLNPNANATMTIDKMSFDRINIPKGYGAGLGLYNGRVFSAGTTSGSITIKDLSFRDGYIVHDQNDGASTHTIEVSTTGLNVQRLTLEDLDIFATTAGTGGGTAINLGGSATCGEISINNCRNTRRNGGFVLSGLGTFTNIYMRAVELGGALNYGLIHGGGNFNLYVDGYDVSAAAQGLAYNYTGNGTTWNITVAKGYTAGNPIIKHNNANNINYNLRSGGGNVSNAGDLRPIAISRAAGTPTLNIRGWCGDLAIDLNNANVTIPKTFTGSVIFNTAAAAGTLVQNQLAFSDGTNWRQFNPLNSF